MIPIYSDIGQGMRNHFENLVSWCGKNEFSFLSISKNIFQFLPELRSEIHRDQQCEQRSEVGKRVWQSSALVSPTKTLNRDVAPNGDDIEKFDNLVQMSKWETLKTNPWKQKFPESE